MSVQMKGSAPAAATVDLRPSGYCSLRNAGLAGAAVIALGGSAYMLCSNPSEAVKAAAVVKEIVNPFLPTCPIDATICGLMPDVVEVAKSGMSIITKIALSIGGVFVSTALAGVGTALMSKPPIAPAQ
jgi:hypothetical protein